jgi:hypothetical protein
MIMLIILLTAPICLFEGMPLIKQRRWKELIVLGVLIGLVLFVGIGKTVNLPSPIQIMERWLLPVGKAIFKHF